MGLKQSSRSVISNAEESGMYAQWILNLQRWYLLWLSSPKFSPLVLEPTKRPPQARSKIYEVPRGRGRDTIDKEGRKKLQLSARAIVPSSPVAAPPDSLSGIYQDGLIDSCAFQRPLSLPPL